MWMCKKRNTTKIALCGLSLIVSSQILAEDVMVISASGFEQQVQNAPASISVVTKKDLENKPYRDVTDALKDIPGVSITGSGGRSDISIRGMDAKYTLILIDGKRVRSREIRPNSDGPGFEQGWLPPISVIERIEVIRGPMSSLYGSDAMGGVINIITKKITKIWTGNIRLESTLPEKRESKNSYTTVFSLTGPVVANALGLQLYGQYSDRDEDTYLNGYPKQKLRSLNSKVAFSPVDNQQFELDLGRTLQNSYQTQSKTTVRDDSERDNQRNSAALTHTGNWGIATSTTSISYESTKNPVRDMKLDNMDIDAQFLTPFGDHILTTGVKYSNQKLHDGGNEISTRSELERWDYAVFAEDEWPIGEQFTVTSGLRYNRDQLYGDHWNPRLYGVYTLTENYTLKGGVSTGYTAPSLRYVVDDWGQITGGGNREYDGVIIGNPDLKPEQSLNYEMSLNYLNADGVSASATAFYTQFRDKIQSYYICDKGKNVGGCPLPGSSKQFDFIQGRENIDRAVIHGAELSLSVPFWSRFLFSSMYTWMKTEQKTGKNKGLALNRTPRNKFNVQLDYQATEKLEFWGKVAYYGDEVSLGKQREQDKYYPGYTLWDLGVSYVMTKNIAFYTGLYNIFNKKIDDNDFGKTLDGRRYWVGLTMNF